MSSDTSDTFLCLKRKKKNLTMCVGPILQVYRDSESTPMVCCDVCQRWVHCQCDGIRFTSGSLKNILDMFGLYHCVQFQFSEDIYVWSLPHSPFDISLKAIYNLPF